MRSATLDALMRYLLGPVPDPHTCDRVTFAGDFQPMITLLDAVQESGEQQLGWVEPHMIWSRRPVFEVVAATAVEAV